MPEYIEREQVAIAFQLRDNNVDEAIAWVTRYGFQFSYDEIKSAGLLIVYGRTGRPYIVADNWWIVMVSEDIFVVDDAAFKRRYELRSI